jgi:hypothetical protein
MYRFAFVLMFLVVVAGTCLAQIDTQKIISSVDVAAIKKIQVEKGLQGYAMRVTIVLSNENAEALRFRNAEFELSFERGKNEKGVQLPPIVLGRASVADQTILGKKDGGASAMELDVLVGPKTEETIDRLTAVYNIIGDPIAMVKMIVKGKAEVGLQLPKGWIFEQGRRLELELIFTPQVQREILMK